MRKTLKTFNIKKTRRDKPRTQSFNYFVNYNNRIGRAARVRVERRRLAEIGYGSYVLCPDRKGSLNSRLVACAKLDTELSVLQPPRAERKKTRTFFFSPLVVAQVAKKTRSGEKNKNDRVRAESTCRRGDVIRYAAARRRAKGELEMII